MSEIDIVGPIEEWAVREPGQTRVWHSGDNAEAHARADKAWFDSRIPPIPATLVKRTVTYGEWEEVNDDE